jgi:hypothetical protein
MLKYRMDMLRIRRDDLNDYTDQVDGPDRC